MRPSWWETINKLGTSELFGPMMIWRKIAVAASSATTTAATITIIIIIIQSKYPNRISNWGDNRKVGTKKEYLIGSSTVECSRRVCLYENVFCCLFFRKNGQKSNQTISAWVYQRWKVWEYGQEKSRASVYLVSSIDSGRRLMRKSKSSSSTAFDPVPATTRALSAWVGQLKYPVERQKHLWFAPIWFSLVIGGLSRWLSIDSAGCSAGDDEWRQWQFHRLSTLSDASLPPGWAPSGRTPNPARQRSQWRQWRGCSCAASRAHSPSSPTEMCGGSCGILIESYK